MVSASCSLESIILYMYIYIYQFPSIPFSQYNIKESYSILLCTLVCPYLSAMHLKECSFLNELQNLGYKATLNWSLEVQILLKPKFFW